METFMWVSIAMFLSFVAGYAVCYFRNQIKADVLNTLEAKLAAAEAANKPKV
jgi:hypothetical protein